MLLTDNFISTFVTKRKESMFASDIEDNHTSLSHEINNKSILVIGGAGTIGSSFIKEILPFNPRSLIVVDINENGLTELTRDLRSSKGNFIPKDYITYPMSYSDSVFKKMFVERGGFDIVANFSAHKHVRSEKDRFSVESLLENNVIKAKKLLDLLCDYPPQHFFCVSTDKAANPVNIMGASKKIMEDMIMAYSAIFPITTARFANVAFSNGSLPAGFIERITKLQPISAPSDVTRYFVSPQESGQICMLACMLGNTGEIYFPKLNKDEVTTFSEIAINLLNYLEYKIIECETEAQAIELSGENISKSKTYPVFFSKSDTTGEKDFEEFYTDIETIDLNRHHALGVVKDISLKKISEIDNLLEALSKSFLSNATTKEKIVEIIKDFLPNFNHHEKGKTLDSKM